MSGKRIAAVAALALLCAFVVNMSQGCSGKKMSDEDYYAIKAQYMNATADEIAGTSDKESNMGKFREARDRFLAEACEEYGYSAQDYKTKTRQMSSSLNEEMEQIITGQIDDALAE